MKINKRILRSIKRKKAFYIGSILLCMLTVSFIIAATSAGNTMNDTVESFYKECNVEDAQMILKNDIQDEELEELEKKFNLQIELMQYADLSVDGTTLRVFKENKKINLIQIKDGEANLSENTILLNNDYAIQNGYELNDMFSLNQTEYIITGYFTRPDYIYMLKSLTDTYADKKLFGIAVVPDSNFSKLNNIQKYYSVVYEKENSMEFRKEINEKYKLLSYIDRYTNKRIEHGSEQGKGVSSMALSFAPILFILNMGLIAVVLSRMVQTERKILGVLFALGYKKKEILRHYSKYSMITAIVGSIFGIGIGILLVKPFLNMYCGQFNFPLYTQQYSIESFIVSIIVPILLFSLTSYMVVKRMLKQSVVELIHGADYKQKKVFMPKILKLSKSMKYGIRTSMRNKGRSIVFIFGVIVASVLILIGLIMNTSIQHLLKEEIQTATSYKYSYKLNQIQTDYSYDTGLPYLVASFETDENKGRISVIGIEFDSKSEFFPLANEDKTELDDDLVYVSRALSELYQLKAGDTFNFHNPVTLKEYSIKIDGVADNRTQKAVYMSLDNASEFLGYQKGSYNGIYSNEELDIDSSIVNLIQTGKEVAKSIEDLLKPLMVVIYILVILGFTLGIIAISIISGMVVDENTSNISMLKVLGYKLKEISKMILNINYWFVLIGYLLAIPISYIFCLSAFRQQIEALNVFVEPKLSIIDLLFSIVLVYLSYYFTILIAKRRANKIDMVESMKDNRE